MGTGLGLGSSEEEEEEEEEEEYDAHKVTVEELCERFNADIQSGLSDLQALQNTKIYGDNKLSYIRVGNKPEWVKLIEESFSGTGFYVWIAAILCFLVHVIQTFLYDDPSSEFKYIGIAMASVVSLTGFMTYYQKYTAFVEMVQQRVPQFAVVKRNGEKVTITSDQLTLGDIVEVTAGDLIPADIRVLEAKEFKVDTSQLTGEGGPQQRGPNFTHDNPLETKNLVFLTTRVLEGSCTGMVVKVGDDTIYGQVHGLSSMIYVSMQDKTPLIHAFVGVSALLYIPLKTLITSIFT